MTSTIRDQNIVRSRHIHFRLPYAFFSLCVLFFFFCVFEYFSEPLSRGTDDLTPLKVCRAPCNDLEALEFDMIYFYN